MPRQVVVVGATGHVGCQVVRELVTRGVPVRALVRPTSNADALTAQGVEIVRGDMTDMASLEAAFRGADVVIKAAAAYMKRHKGDNQDGDRVGNEALARAAKTAGVRRYILLSIVACDRAHDVPHFANAFHGETCLRNEAVPFCIVRAAMFLDQSDGSMFEDNVRANKWRAMGDANATRWSWSYTPDVVDVLVKAALAGPQIEGRVIDVAFREPLTNQDMANLISRATRRNIHLSVLPWWLLRVSKTMATPFSEFTHDMLCMFLFFRTGLYIADVSKCEELFGPLPTAEDAVRRWATEKDLVDLSQQPQQQPPARPMGVTASPSTTAAGRMPAMPA